MRAFLAFLLLTLLLTGCAQAEVEAPPAPSPTSAVRPTDPAPGPPPPDEPVATAQLLPAPLYMLESGQIARIERDMVTRAVVTAERVELPGVEAIAEFTVASDGTLAYIVGDVTADRLVLTDARGEDLRVIYEEAQHELSDLLFTPDSSAIIFRLLNNRQPADPSLPSGIYRLPREGGALELLRPDDPVDDPVNPARTVSGYRPVAFAPDRTALLVEVFALFYEDCTLGVMASDGGEVTRITVPEGVQVLCDEAVWTTASDAVFLLAVRVDGDQGQDGPTLWRTQRGDGMAVPLLTQPDIFARAPLSLPGQAVQFFLAQLQRDLAGLITGATFTPVRLDSPEASPTPLGPSFARRLDGVLWAPDGSGALVALGSFVEAEGEDNRPVLRWLPREGSPVDLPTARMFINGLAWAPEE
ncbi:hypothetical protein EYB53_020145 [Candidatus Chloroploca sp. M-50]|uniref:Uncharacterized protein n=1 Tax=Candidatus Chloroploca mongolica TaxID=2528176 RepID=A0ABS4DF30_9CHLR|nr:hypothetical protein [Candidatus Chloroploca mongolica]MBP1468040.1 hypothetical protein [Candidatus Chloroploca mongolica]